MGLKCTEVHTVQILNFISLQMKFFSFMTVKKRYIMFLFHQTVYKVVIMRDHMGI